MTSANSVSGGKTYSRLLSYLKDVRGIFIISICGMVVLAFVEMNLARIMGPLLEVGFIERNNETIKLVMQQMALLFLARGFASLLVIYLGAKISRSVIYKLRQQIFEKLLVLPTREYDKRTTGEFVSMVTFNTEQVAQSTTSVINVLVKDTLTIIFLIGLMLYINIKISLLFFLIVPLIAFFFRVVSKRFRKVSFRIQDSMSDSTQVIEEVIDGHRVVKVFGGEAHETDKFNKANKNNLNQNVKLGLVQGLMEPFVQIVALLFLIALIYMAVFQEGIAAQEFIQLISAILLIFPSLKRLANVNVALQRGIAAAESVFALIDSEPEKNSGDYSQSTINGDIEIKQLSFAYETGASVLNDISLNIKAGQTVAFVGRSGSGKSTLVNLIPRLYSDFSGEILLDGQSINNYQLSNLRQHISYVGQDVTLFNDTVANNIAYGHSEKFDRKAILAAAKAANCMSFIEKMPQGFDTMIGEDGVLLSGGQRQRLAIARALLKDAPILILDEATSALDSESEEKIQTALERLMQNRTTLVIAHRLSTVENADNIVVMEAGSIIEQGSHQALLQQKGQYAALYNLQFNADAMVDEPEPKETYPVPVENKIVEYRYHGQNYLSNKRGNSLLEKMWYGAHPITLLFLPITWVFGLLVALRKYLYNSQLIRSFKAQVPIIVVGNVTVGGTGKTPMVIWLANHLQKRGYSVGIISRGYKGKSTEWPLLVDALTDPALSGDEAVIIAKRTGCPVMVGPERKLSVQRLVNDFACDIIVSDDGLQHYALQRDLEILVTDGARGFGNGLLLPAGPMRESHARVKECDLVVANGARLPNAYSMFMVGETLHSLSEEKTLALDDLAGATVHAVAAIGNPDRFFDLLRARHMQVIEHPKPDHAEFFIEDLDFKDDYPVIVTEKDAVKCMHLLDALQNKAIYYLPVEAQFDNAFIDSLNEKISALTAAPKIVESV